MCLVVRSFLRRISSNRVLIIVFQLREREYGYKDDNVIQIKEKGKAYKQHHKTQEGTNVVNSFFFSSFGTSIQSVYFTRPPRT